MDLASGFEGWLQQAVGALWAWAVPATLQATVLLGFAWLADRLLARRAWPQALSLLWILALARFFLPPDLGSPVSVTRSLGAPALEAASVTPPAGALVAGAALWLAGAALLVAARAIRRARVRRRLRTASVSRAWQSALASCAAQIGLRVAPRVATLDSAPGPAVLGTLSPVLLLPRAWLERAPTRRDRHALLHELAHVARRDLWLDEAVALVRALLWCHPLVWIAAGRLHELSELQCDQTVARALGRDAHAYRETLILATRDALAATGRATGEALARAGRATPDALAPAGRATTDALAPAGRATPDALAPAAQATPAALPPAPRATRDALPAAARATPAALPPSQAHAFVGHGNAMIARIERLERAVLRPLAIVRAASATLAFAVAACVLPMAPTADELRDQARATFAAAARGERLSCFTLRAAAMVLAAEGSPPSPESER